MVLASVLIFKTMLITLMCFAIWTGQRNTTKLKSIEVDKSMKCLKTLTNKLLKKFFFFIFGYGNIYVVIQNKLIIIKKKKYF